MHVSNNGSIIEYKSAEQVMFEIEDAANWRWAQVGFAVAKLMGLGAECIFEKYKENEKRIEDKYKNR